MPSPQDDRKGVSRPGPIRPKGRGQAQGQPLLYTMNRLAGSYIVGMAYIEFKRLGFWHLMDVGFLFRECQDSELSLL
jgi:hypothetical protein